jgi:activator of HSP90 ATPase
MNAGKHAAAVGSQYVTIDPRVGGRFAAFTMLTGRFLFLKKDKMIVQTWRAKSWKKKDPDSILVITLHKVKGGTRVDLIHTGLPEYDYRPIIKGWPKYYWRPWRKYLSRK